MTINGKQVKILAQIITYNPEIELLQKNIESILHQVDNVLIYDNGSANIKEFGKYAEEEGCILIISDKNNGIAEALHYGVEYAEKNGYKYVYALDQDTVSNYNVIEILVNCMEKDENIAVLSCGTSLRFDEDFAEKTFENEVIYDPIGIDVMTAGSCSRVSSIIQIGNYNKKLFIDQVDRELGLRLVESGFKCGICMAAAMQHAVGYHKQHLLFGKKYYTPNYPAFRYYYIFRNSRYLALKYPLLADVKGYNKGFINSLKYIISIILFEQCKFKKSVAILRGIINGKKMYKFGKVIPYNKKFPY